MGKTIAEKIIGEHAGKSVNAGEFVVAKVDVTAVQDGTGPLTIEEMRKIGLEKAINPSEQSCLLIMLSQVHAKNFQTLI